MAYEEHVAANRELWTRGNAQYTDAAALAAWLQDEITWGMFHVREREIRVLPTDLAGLDVVELGCGTAYLSALAGTTRSQGRRRGPHSRPARDCWAVPARAWHHV